MTVITRFAPSPTGNLHIGSARTALFNWLFARHHGGKFYLRIEDTDRERSTQESIDAIYRGMEWLGLDWEGDVIFQFARAPRHVEVVNQLIAKGRAYYCYTTPEELEVMRERARAESRPPRYDGTWREKDPKEAPSGIKPVVRLKAPHAGSTTITDLLQGDVTVANNQLDDMILLRSDGTPTYMLSVVVDDHDMGITHVIRGDDHLNNMFRQYQLYLAMDWTPPAFAHIPLIHGPDGAKLSKRHGATGTEAYKDMGYLPEAMRNYLLRLGWSHGDDEVISTEQAIQWFNMESIGKSAARFDFKKLENLNGIYMREADNGRLVTLIEGFLRSIPHVHLTTTSHARLLRGMNGLKTRSKTLVELAESAAFYCVDSIILDEAALSILTENKTLIHDVVTHLESITQDNWNEVHLEEFFRNYAEKTDTKLGKVIQPLRVALTGKTVSPSVFEIMEILGKGVSLERITQVVQ